MRKTIREKNGCHNRPLKFSTYPVQDGWTYSDDGTTRTPNIVHLESTMSQECQYDRQSTDTYCTGCCRLRTDPAAKSL